MFNNDDMIKQARADTQRRVLFDAERMIWITFQHEGIHSYPAAATDPALATSDEYDVSFLANPHRHIFHFKIAIEIFHNDREIEFIQFKRYCHNLFDNGVLTLNNKSCEMISDDLYEQIGYQYPNRDIEISVAEDNENGSKIIYNKLQQ